MLHGFSIVLSFIFLHVYVADVYYDVSLYVYCKPIASIAHVLYTDTQAFIHRHRSLGYFTKGKRNELGVKLRQLRNKCLYELN